MPNPPSGCRCGHPEALHHQVTFGPITAFQCDWREETREGAVFCCCVYTVADLPINRKANKP